MDFSDTEKLFYTIIRTSILTIVALLFTIVALIGLGALAEDSQTMSAVLAHFTAKSLIALFAFFAAKMPLLVLAKWTAINGSFSALLWRETIKPESIKSLFTFSTDAAYFNKRMSFSEVFRPIMNLYRTSVENRIKYFTNPFTMIISLIKTAENFCLFVVDRLPPRSTYGMASFPLYRAIKGAIILICELPAMLLALIGPIANIPYYLLHFFAITLPDFVMWLFFEFKVEKTTSTVSQQPSVTLTIDTTRYINQKLLHPEETSEE